jgi:hypothetical protein
MPSGGEFPKNRTDKQQQKQDEEKQQADTVWVKFQAVKP